MSTLLDMEDRPSCLPGIKSEIHFPKIKPSFNTSPVRATVDNNKYFDNNNNHYSNKNYCGNGHTNGGNKDSQNHSRSKEVNKTFYMPPPFVRESSSMLKLPSIDCSKSNHISCLPGDMCKEEHLTSFNSRLDPLTTLSQSQRCSSQIDISNSNRDEKSNSLTENDTSRSNISGSTANSLLVHTKDDLAVRFPSVFQHQNGHMFAPTRSCVATSSMAHLCQGTASSSCGSLSRQNMGLIGLKSKISPMVKASNTPRSGQGGYALLLPISTSQEYRNRENGKRKRQNNR